MSDATRSPAARCGTYPAVQREQPVTLADALTAVQDLAHALAEIALAIVALPPSTAHRNN